MNLLGLRSLSAALAVAVSLATSIAAAQTSTAYEPQVGQAGKDVVWVPTPDDVVNKMLDLVQVQKGERHYDLGAGDGKIAIAAAKRGAIAKGIEYNPDMVKHAQAAVKKAGVNAEIMQGDIFVANFSDADVITLYLLPHLNEKLRPILLDMKPGTRVTSHAFRMGDWEPDETASVSGREAHFWRVPAKIEGDWETRVGNNPGPRIRITQAYQKIEAKAEWDGKPAAIKDAKVNGAQVTFTITDPAGVPYRFEATTDHRGPMLGTAAADKGARKLFMATRRSQP